MKEKLLISMFLFLIILLSGCGSSDDSQNVLLQGDWVSDCHDELLVDPSRVASCITQLSIQTEGSLIISNTCSESNNCLADDYEIQPIREYEYVLGENVKTENGLSAQIIELIFLHPDIGAIPVPSIIYNITGNQLYLGEINDDNTYTLNMDVPYTKL